MELMKNQQDFLNGIGKPADLGCVEMEIGYSTIVNTLF